MSVPADPRRVHDARTYEDDYAEDTPCPWCGAPTGDVVCTCDIDGLGPHPGYARAHRIYRTPGSPGPSSKENSTYGMVLVRRPVEDRARSSFGLQQLTASRRR